jgi:hypothetical protein
MKKAGCFIFILISILYFSRDCHAQNNTIDSYVNTSCTIAFNSSDDELNNTFMWAKKQALAYAFSGDAVGLWYEAALPGREVFCMRDVAHQAMGAHFLGLASHTKNMLYTIAKNISDSRDWCSLWEITRHGTPALQDYLNDAEFWYNLPANFDILDCCFRMYELTGDQAYLTDPVLLNFYKKTVYDYVVRWDIGIDKVMNRSRLMNNTPDNNRRFENVRGIPGYNEGDPGYTASLDLLVTEQAAFEAYAQIQQLCCNEEEALKFYARAEDVNNFINTVWWDNENQRYYTHVSKDHELNSRGFDRSILYWGSLKDTLKLRSTIRAVVDNLPMNPRRGIEVQSHMPEVLYKYEETEKAYEMLLFVTKNERREYPEVSFSTIGAMVAGLMGIEMETYPHKESIENGGYGEQIFTTKSRLTNKTKWAEVNHVPIKRNDISVRHDGVTKTTFNNHAGPQLQWKAYFTGFYETLLLNGVPQKATTEILLVNGEKVSWIWVPVGPGETFTVQAVK